MVMKDCIDVEERTCLIQFIFKEFYKAIYVFIFVQYGFMNCGLPFVPKFKW